MFTQQETIDVPSRLVRKNTYALRVRGDSMKDANILDGDVVVIEQSQMAENGEKVVVRINQHEVTLKTLRLDQDGVKLIPANSTMSPIILNNADVEVLGIVRGVIRDRV
jgi:repressor LexA